MEKSGQFSQKQKLDILESAQEIGIKEASQAAGVHYTSVYEWRRKLEALGQEAFLAYQPPTIGRGIKRITAEQEEAVLETWGRHRGFGPSQVRNQLRRQGVTISTRSVQRIMEANGYRGIRKKAKKPASHRFEASRPLELVQIDIMECFIHKLKVYVVLLLDDFSRFILGSRLFTETSIDAMIGLIQEAMDRYGKMEELLSDRGFVFYSWRGANRFERFLDSEGIHHTHSRPHHPQTLGKVEATIKRVQKELFGQEEFGGISEAEEALSQWVERFNYRRVHQGLGGCLVPADRFHGRVQAVQRDLSEGIDPDGPSSYTGQEIARSLLNVMLDGQGRLSMYILGRSVSLFGGSDG